MHTDESAFEAHWYGINDIFNRGKPQATEHASEFLPLLTTPALGSWPGGKISNWHEYRDFARAFQIDCLSKRDDLFVHVRPIADYNGRIRKSYMYNSLLNLLLVVDGGGQFRSMFRPRVGNPGNDLRYLRPHVDGNNYFLYECH